MYKDSKNNKWELYAKWVHIQEDPKDPHTLIVKLFRHKPMKHKYIQKMNDLYSGKNISFWVDTNDNYDSIKKVIAEEVARKKQAQL